MNLQVMPRTDLVHWKGCLSPGQKVLTGSYACLEPLDWATHTEGLYAAVGGPENETIWNYMPVGPFMGGAQAFADAFEGLRTKGGWRTMVIRDVSCGEVLGMASYMLYAPTRNVRQC